MKLPNALPRPRGELAALERVWKPPQGWRVLSAVNNTYIGLYYIATALLFFVLAGALALIMRLQLAAPENTLVDPSTYNQLFTMHGTIMMFLFAVPAVEAVGVLLLPNMLGARDLPFPRLGAYAFWAYFFGGLAFFGTLFFGVAPDGGWFMYPPLSGIKYSPGINTDFWLLGIGFIEISAIAGAVEIIVGILRTRAPGMGLNKLPIYAWAMLVLAAMIVFAFPAVILATTLLELERAFDWPFFIAERGGDPLLWQHLFWFFGHPEVYIIFLPAAGMVSMIVPTMARVPLVGYRMVVLGLVGTGLLSFGLWVHHMFTTGIPNMALGFFSAASVAVAVPTAMQVFAWIATLSSGRLQWRTPLYFILGFLLIFVIGGLTGVMLAIVPFDWQVHDTYFVVAHLHYVLFGGMVFPLFAAFYYWAPFASKKPMSERLGRWVCGLMFVGANVAFFPMHITGLAGMPRRTYTYRYDLGWDLLNLVSTVGAFMIAAGVLVFLIDVARNFRFSAEENAGNIWNAGTLEWLPTGTYSIRSVPAIHDWEPLWAHPELAREVESGQHYLPNSATGRRETIATAPVDARPQYVMLLPGPGWSPLIAALATAVFFYLLTFKLLVPAGIVCVIGMAAILVWLWPSDPGPMQGDVDIGGGIKLPTYCQGSVSHSWWAVLVVIAVSSALFISLVFSYLYLWSVSSRMWPTLNDLPDLGYGAVSAALLVTSSVAMLLGRRAASSHGSLSVVLAIGLALVALIIAWAVELFAQRSVGVDPTASSYGALVYTTLSVQGFYVVVLMVMSLYTIARVLTGKVTGQRRITFDNTMLLWHYTAIQGMFAVALLHGFPRLVG